MIVHHVTHNSYLVFPLYIFLLNSKSKQVSPLLVQFSQKSLTVLLSFRVQSGNTLHQTLAIEKHLGICHKLLHLSKGFWDMFFNAHNWSLLSSSVNWNICPGTLPVSQHLKKERALAKFSSSMFPHYSLNLLLLV